MKQLKWMALCVVPAALALIAPAAATATPFSYPFNDSNQNFAVLQNGGSTPATLVATGGNPGGFIRLTDAIAETGCPSAAPCDPSLFEGPNPLPGSLTANYGGTWSFDFKTDVAPTVNKNLYLIINNASAEGLVKSIPPANTTNWQHFSGSLTEPGWLLYDFGVGTNAPATAAQFKSVLSAAIATDVQPDVYTGSGEHYGLDNFVFTNGPQPAASVPAGTPTTTAPAKRKCKKGRKLKHGKCVKRKVRR